MTDPTQASGKESTCPRSLVSDRHFVTFWQFERLTMKDRIDWGHRSKVMKHVARGGQIGRFGAAPKLAKSDSHWQCLAKKGPDRQTEHLTDPILCLDKVFCRIGDEILRCFVVQSNVNGSGSVLAAESPAYQSFAKCWIMIRTSGANSTSQPSGKLVL